MGFFDNHGLNYRRKVTDEASFERQDLHGIQASQKEATLTHTRAEAEIQRNLQLGLEAAESIGDRTISCFSRGELPHWAGINTFLKLPYLEDVNKVDEFDVAVLGVPFDIGTTYRSGTRFGPQAIRRISALYQTYNYEMGVDLREQLKICDLGDVFTIANIEKSFDQITKAVSHVMSKGTMPVILGGDHSIGYPCLRGVAENVEGNIGIIHLDRHIDIQEKDMDERMHTTPWFHATNIPNAPAVNLVQIGIGGWQVPRAGVKVGRERGTTIMTINDVESLGIDKVAEMALETAWKGAKAVYLSFDIDSIDCGFVPGTGWPEPGGFLPREALKLMQLVAKEGLAAMEVVEVAPAYDISDTTALLACRAVLDVLATMVDNGKIGGR
ncbi:agmatinase family protein [Paenibacillus sp. sptzw28]|uniref:agmatinase family protein n=1 Tax=Paenibacillus sp. sptzw28 TaxID=715179 RepID=UPI001C6E3E9F|nr:agmatinase family protein [Paenibacillus sp. sptzw28]QYR21662.1 agmatinase family protein [Paenibacillus sp. sptzw28]